jgi:hypothetical protein
MPKSVGAESVGFTANLKRIQSTGKLNEKTEEWDVVTALAIESAELSTDQVERLLSMQHEGPVKITIAAKQPNLPGT